MSVWTPCKKVCFVDPKVGLCVGCFRSLDELGRWTSYSDDERKAIKRELALREENYRKMKGESA